MIDFSKKLKSTKINKKINPIEIYDELDRGSETGPLRPIQKRVLDNWYKTRKHDKDLIIKLHTGAGKTLIGLLMLTSYINDDKGPCLYVCPNIYLYQQVCTEAKKFGIPFCYIKDDNIIPEEYFTGKKILITHVQKVFNGLTIFGLNNKSILSNAIILDDSHACMESIKSSCTISIPMQSDIYKEIKNLFVYELKKQGEGSFLELDDEYSSVVMEIPYWDWYDKKSEVIEILKKYKNERYIKYNWELMKDIIHKCNAYISNKKIEIVPNVIPISNYGTFYKSKHRILMSATTQEDTFFIKGLGLEIESIKNPLIDYETKWSGEKMILFPDLICESIESRDILKELITTKHDNFGIVSIVPSFSQVYWYKNLGAIIANEESKYTYENIKKLKNLNLKEYGQNLVLANRYDGIDLPDNSCRILIIDSVPYSNSLCEEYEEICRANSKIIKIKKIQKVEQGMGRSVRGEKDYSVIIIMGKDLINLIRGQNTKKYFSSQTIKQIDIADQIVEFSKEENEENEYKRISAIIGQCLNRDDAWKAFYKEEMDDIEEINSSEDTLYKKLLAEKCAYDYFLKNNYEDACKKIQGIVDEEQDEEERGWYLQLLAQYKYPIEKTTSLRLQNTAFNLNNQLLKPIEGIHYTKLKYIISDNQVNIIKTQLSKFDDFNSFIIELENILADCSFGIKSEKFEYAIMKIGELLGYKSHRPDKSIRKGPDNLWCVGNDKYIIIECKSEVRLERKAISKDEAGQMEQHCAWFEEEYGDSSVQNILIIPTNKLADDAYFSHDISIMVEDKLKLFKDNIKKFYLEFKNYDLKTLGDIKIQESLVAHSLDNKSILNKYVVKPE